MKTAARMNLNLNTVQHANGRKETTSAEEPQIKINRGMTFEECYSLRDFFNVSSIYCYLVKYMYFSNITRCQVVN
jgi:hypothetical protein